MASRRLSPDDFAEVILRAANSDGDSDSIACIADGIAGAALGVDAIPSRKRRILSRLGKSATKPLCDVAGSDKRKAIASALRGGQCATLNWASASIQVHTA